LFFIDKKSSRPAHKKPYWFNIPNLKLKMMFVLQNKQLDVFKELALKKFEEEMVAHIQEFFPAQMMMMQEVGVRNTIRYGYVRAVKHGFTTKRNVCLYLNNMLELGSNFDTDLQYPWAQSILQDSSEQNASFRIDKLSDKTLDLIIQIAGINHLPLYRALLNLHKHSDVIFETLIHSDLTSATQRLKLLFAHKYEIIGEVNMRNLIQYGINKAPDYGLTSESNRLMYIVFMFMMGSGFDKDPQYAWAGEILKDTGIKDQNEKVKLLYQNIIHPLGILISALKYS
jgi:hypothetical protein